MPKLKAQNEAVRELKGLHLYHAGWSNCSMRVRMTLAEKGLQWSSHHLDTRLGEHITPEYFGINPKGLVPALVHDGDVWTESCDIIRYLDDTYPIPRLTAADALQQARQAEWLSLASTIHVSAVKTFIYAATAAGRPRRTHAEIERYQALQTDAELLAFHAKNSSDAGISAAERRHAERQLHDAFVALDRQLGKQRWLAGENFTLADITWVPLHYTLQRAGFDFGRFTHVTGWANAIAQRASFRDAVLRWFDGPPEGSAANVK
jgi:GST-like protein